MQKKNPVIKNYILSSEKRIINESLFNNMFYIKTKKAETLISAFLFYQFFLFATPIKSTMLIAKETIAYTMKELSAR